MELDLTADINRRNARRLARTGRHAVRDLALIRDRRGISRSKLADVIGIHKSGVSRFERGASDPRLSTLLRYAHAVGAALTIKVETVEDWDAGNEFDCDSVRTTRLNKLWSETDGDDDFVLSGSHSAAFSGQVHSSLTRCR